ncbi:MAG: trigger factor [Bacteroidaceae bacterium]
MNISLENVDKVSALLSIKMEKADYQEKVEKTLKTFRQKANVPGFRPGKVPMGMVVKLYGTEAKAEEVNKLLSETIYKYLSDNKVNMLGEPLPSDKQKDFDLVKEDEFEFVFDIALAPEFKAELTTSDAIDFYSIEVSEKMIDNQVAQYTQRAGSYKKVDAYEAKDMLKGLLAELDENGNTKTDGIQVEGAILMPDYFKNDDQKAIFNNCKVNDVLTFSPTTAYEGRDTEIASLLKIEKENVANYTGNFSFQITEITRFEAAELNQTIFDQVFGEGTIKTEEEFRAKVKAGLAQQYVADSDYKFLLDVRAYLTGKVGSLEYPDALLKKIMLANHKDKGEQFVEENYAKSIEELTWHLIKEQLIKENDIKIDDKDLKETAKDATRFQFSQYGMMNIPEEMLENYATEMLKKKEQVDALVERCIDSKLSAQLKTIVTLNSKTISIEDFNKMFA